MNEVREFRWADLAPELHGDRAIIRAPMIEDAVNPVQVLGDEEGLKYWADGGTP